MKQVFEEQECTGEDGVLNVVDRCWWARIEGPVYGVCTVPSFSIKLSTCQVI